MVAQNLISRNVKTLFRYVKIILKANVYLINIMGPSYMDKWVNHASHCVIFVLRKFIRLSVFGCHIFLLDMLINTKTKRDPTNKNGMPSMHDSCVALTYAVLTDGDRRAVIECLIEIHETYST